MITYEDFQNVELRTARVTAAREHPNADRLLLLDVDLGELGTRQIVAGIKGSYAPEELVGKTIVLVANLEPATLRGERSEGMLLAVKDDEGVCVLTTDRAVASGLKVT